MRSLFRKSDCRAAREKRSNFVTSVARGLESFTVFEISSVQLPIETCCHPLIATTNRSTQLPFRLNYSHQLSHASVPCMNGCGSMKHRDSVLSRTFSIRFVHNWAIDFVLAHWIDGGRSASWRGVKRITCAPVSPGFTYAGKVEPFWINFTNLESLISSLCSRHGAEKACGSSNVKLLLRRKV